ncbi:MAG: hypothetical protein KGO05_13000, partial [Chloroflexota bacterium]|nr:hypothetical protein [Chloroflexota bacterium]
MDDFSAAHLRFDASVTLHAASASYPAREVAAAIARGRHVRWRSRRPPERPELAETLAPWSDLRWRWREDDREMTIGFSVASDADRAPDATWRASEVGARCHYADFIELALALSRRFPTLTIRSEDGVERDIRGFIAEVAQTRLAPALASADAATRERAEEAETRYLALLAE